MLLSSCITQQRSATKAPRCFLVIGADIYALAPHNLVNDSNGCIDHARVHAPSAVVREVRRRNGEEGWMENCKLNAVIIDVAPYETETPPSGIKTPEKEEHVKTKSHREKSLGNQQKEEKLMSALNLVVEDHRYHLMHGKSLLLLVQPFTPHWDDVIVSSVFLGKKVRRLHAAWQMTVKSASLTTMVSFSNKQDKLPHLQEYLMNVDLGCYSDDKLRAHSARLLATCDEANLFDDDEKAMVAKDSSLNYYSWIADQHTKIDLPTNQRDYDNSETTVGKLLVTKIQICRSIFL